MKLNEKLKMSARLISFILVLTFLLVSFSYMLAPKDNTKSSGINNPNANGFFSEPKNTVDLAIIGNSDAYSGFSPMELWNKYGYTSYVSAEGAQTVSQGYSMLKKVLTCHTPKVVILETDGCFTKSKITQSIINIVSSSMGTSFSIFQYHDRWKHIKFRDLLRKPEYTAHCPSKGQKTSNDINGYMGPEYMTKTNRKAPLSVAVTTSLDAFRKLCTSNDIQLIFVEMPSQTSWNYPKHNAIQEYADKYDIPFLDLNIDREKFDFDWKVDTRDKGNHLNNSGARKATLFVGKYLEENCNLPDHRNDKKYETWHKDYKHYKKQVRI